MRRVSSWKVATFDEGRGVVRPVLELGVEQEQELGTLAPLVDEELGVGELPDGRPMAKARSGDQEWVV